MSTTRETFNESFLSEMPENIGNFELFDTLEYNLLDRIKYDDPISLANDLFKLEQDVIYYWYEINKEIALILELGRGNHALVVHGIGKNPAFSGRKPFASDIYNAVLEDSAFSIVIKSDTQLSEEGFKVWVRLLQQGHKISLYNKNNPGQSFKTIDSIEDLQKYFRADDTAFRDYQFVLSESSWLGETRAIFNTRRMRELAGTL